MASPTIAMPSSIKSLAGSAASGMLGDHAVLASFYKRKIEGQERGECEAQNQAGPNRSYIERVVIRPAKEDEAGLQPDQEAGCQARRVLAESNRPPHVPKAVHKTFQSPPYGEEQE